MNHPILLRRNTEELRRAVEKGSESGLVVMPEGGLLPVADGDGHGIPKQRHTHNVARKLRANPWAASIVPLQPRTTLSKTLPKPFEVRTAKPPKHLRVANHLSVHQRVSPSSGLTIISTPDEAAQDLVNFAKSPLGQRDDRHMKGGRRGKDCLGERHSSGPSDVLALPS